MKKTKKKGFTLVELIVVIAIIAILAAVAVPLTITYLDKAEVGATEDEIALIKGALPLTITEMNIKETGKVTAAIIGDDIATRLTLPEHIGSLILKIDKDGNVTATIKGKKCYNKISTDADYNSANTTENAIVDWPVGKISTSVLNTAFNFKTHANGYTIEVIKTTGSTTAWDKTFTHVADA